jgi:hypothetical protein
MNVFLMRCTSVGEDSCFVPYQKLMMIFNTDVHCYLQIHDVTHSLESLELLSV